MCTLKKQALVKSVAFGGGEGGGSGGGAVSRLLFSSFKYAFSDTVHRMILVLKYPKHVEQRKMS